MRRIGTKDEEKCRNISLDQDQRREALQLLLKRYGSIRKHGEVNATIYSINETIRLGNVTVLVIGDISRLGVHLDIYIFGVPLTNYNATTVLQLPNGTTITMNATVEYIGHLHIQLCYDVPMDEEGKYMLLPQGTVLRIVIHPLNLAIEITLK